MIRGQFIMRSVMLSGVVIGLIACGEQACSPQAMSPITTPLNITDRMMNCPLIIESSLEFLLN